MKDYYVNLTGVWSVEDLHSRLATGLYLPPYYGRNLDALYDLMTEFSGHIHLYGTREVCGYMEDYVAGVRETMQEAAEENPRLAVEIES